MEGSLNKRGVFSALSCKPNEKGAISANEINKQRASRKSKNGPKDDGTSDLVRKAGVALK